MPIITITRKELLSDLTYTLKAVQKGRYNVAVEDKNLFEDAVSKLNFTLQAPIIGNEADGSILTQHFEKSRKSAPFKFPFIWKSVLITAINVWKNSSPEQCNEISFDIPEEDFRDVITLEALKFPAFFSCGHVMECSSAGIRGKCYSCSHSGREISSKEIDFVPKGLFRIIERLHQHGETKNVENPSNTYSIYQLNFLDELCHTRRNFLFLLERLNLRNINEWLQLLNSCVSRKEKLIILSLSRETEYFLDLCKQIKQHINHEELLVFINELQESNNANMNLQYKFLQREIKENAINESLPLGATLFILLCAGKLSGKINNKELVKFFIVAFLALTCPIFLNISTIFKIKKCMVDLKELSQLKQELSNQHYRNDEQISLFSADSKQIFDQEQKEYQQKKFN